MTYFTYFMLDLVLITCDSLPLKFCFNCLICLSLSLNRNVNDIFISCSVCSSFCLSVNTDSNSFSVTKEGCRGHILTMLVITIIQYLPSTSELMLNLQMLFLSFVFFLYRILSYKSDIPY